MSYKRNNNTNNRRSNFPGLFRDTMQQKRSQNDRLLQRRKYFFLVGLPLMALIGVLMNLRFINRGESRFDLSIDVVPPAKRSPTTITTTSAPAPASSSWCDRVQIARNALKLSHLRITYPCERMKPAVSAIVCMLTGGSTEKKASRIVFTARDYINGARSLGASLQKTIDKSQTHQLLLLREGFELSSEDLIRLEAVGWTIGTAPNFPLKDEYIPKFPRYKTTYTKVTAIGLSEYKCVMLLDADTLVVGDLREVMKCDTVFQHPNNQVGGTLDWYRMGWKFFNTGSLLWKTDTVEMERVFRLTENPSFMKRFPSDQDFLNNVYPERLRNTTLNNEIVALDTVEARGDSGSSSSSSTTTHSHPNTALNPIVPHGSAKTGAVLPLSWDYNAQTHAEVQHRDFWNSHRPTVRILHFTEKKGWQCERTTDEPPPLEEMPTNCKREIPICFCREAYLYWRALETAEIASKSALEIAAAAEKG